MLVCIDNFVYFTSARVTKKKEQKNYYMDFLRLLNFQVFLHNK